MAFNLSGQLNRFRGDQSQWVTTIFYFSIALVIVTVFCYAMFSFKVYLQNQQIEEVNQKILEYASGKNRIDEQRIITYKRKLDDFAGIINNHRISSNIFNLMEAKTLPDVWFSGFNVSSVQGNINFSGTAKSMDALASQINLLENSKEFISKISLLSTQSGSSGTITFTLSVAFNPSIFNYRVVTPAPAPISSSDAGDQAGANTTIPNTTQ